MSRRFSTVSLTVTGVALGAAAAPAAASSLDVKVEIPRLAGAEVHRPYVAIWVEGASAPARTLSLWYDSKAREDGGRKWLAEMRQWWRKTGRNLQVPADGITGATRAAGPQSISFGPDHPGLKDLPPGQYQLGVEAAREHGGEEVVKVPFSWPPKAAKPSSAKGSAELGQITVVAKP